MWEEQRICCETEYIKRINTMVVVGCENSFVGDADDDDGCGDLNLRPNQTSRV